MSALTGNLADLEINGILNFIQVTKKDGILKIKSDNVSGEIYFKESKIVYAIDQEENTGEVALFNLFKLKKGNFAFDISDQISKGTISIKINEAFPLLEEKLKEWEKISKKILNLNFGVSLVAEPKLNEIKIEPSQWIIAAQIDNIRSIKELSKITGYSLLDTAKLVYSLVIIGLAKINTEDDINQDENSADEQENEDEEGEDEEGEYEEGEYEEGEDEGGEHEEGDKTSLRNKKTRNKRKKGFFRR